MSEIIDRITIGNTTKMIKDTTYESKQAASGGTDVSLVTTGEKYTWNNKGSGTITGITMNGVSKGTSGVVNLGTVLTEMPTASDTVLGGVKVGSGLSISEGVLSATGGSVGGVSSITMNNTSYEPTDGVVNLGTVITAHQDVSDKADKVASATDGNFAALDTNGNLTDSGHKHSDYLTSHQDISGKVDIGSIAIVADGNTHVAISSGQYVYVRSHSTLAEGLYKASTAIAANVALSSSNVTAVPGGGINALNASITTLYSRLPKVVTVTVSYGSITGKSYSSDMETTISNVPTGFTPVGVVGWNLTGSGYTMMVVVKAFINSSNKLATRLRNHDESARTITGTFYVLCTYSG